MHDPGHFLLVSADSGLLAALQGALANEPERPDGQLVALISLADALRRGRPHFVALDERAGDARIALELLRPVGGPDVPLLVLCGPGRQPAGVAAMNDGAADFLPTDDLSRLAPRARRWRQRHRDDLSWLCDFFD